MLNWIHKLFNPHCSHCIDEIKDNPLSQLVEYLKLENSMLRQERDKLLNKLLEPEVMYKEKEKEEESIQPLNKFKNAIPWSVRKQMLESEDRHKAQLMKEVNRNPEIEKQEIEELEKELDIATAKRQSGSD